MAHLLRGKQAGIQKDLSEGLSPDLFGIDDVCFLALQASSFAIVETLTEQFSRSLHDAE